MRIDQSIDDFLAEDQVQVVREVEFLSQWNGSIWKTQP